MRKFNLVIILVIIFFLNGCGEEFFRFPSVEIPFYDISDYQRLLSSGNEEIVYNAICNLIKSAGDLASTLSKESEENNEGKRKTAKDIYKNITDKLQSANPQIVSSAIHFLSIFGTNYKDKEEIINSLLKVKSNNYKVQFELVDALTVLADSSTKIEDKFIDNFLNSKSWVVSRKTYDLVNSLENEGIRLNLIGKYKTAQDEAEKLLILRALSNNYTDNTFDILKGEILAKDDMKIKNYIFEILHQAKDKKKVLDWLNENYGKLDKEDIESLAQTDYYQINSEFGSQLMVILINSGFNPKVNLSIQKGEEGVPSLFSFLSEGLKELSSKKDIKQEEAEELSRLNNVESALLNSPFLKEDWLKYKESKREETFSPEFVEEYNANLNDFFVKTKNIYEKYKIEKGDERIESLKNTLSIK